MRSAIEGNSIEQNITQRHSRKGNDIRNNIQRIERECISEPHHQPQHPHIDRHREKIGLFG